MELEKKTTILFPPDLHAYLARLAASSGVSLGQMVREACVEKYGFVSAGERLEALKELARLALPVGEPADMKAESVPDEAEPR